MNNGNKWYMAIVVGLIINIAAMAFSYGLLTNQVSNLAVRGDMRSSQIDKLCDKVDALAQRIVRLETIIDSK